ncbi:MAG TPA: dipicolinate synthase subunit B [Clostridia bacterium]
MKGLSIGWAMTGSFCTLRSFLPVMQELTKENNVIPIFSFSVAKLNTRFTKAVDFFNEVYEITQNKPIVTIEDAEPIGPKKILDILIIAPCTGNTLAKLNNAITDTPVLMAAKAHLRNERPLVLALSTNDALASNAVNIGGLLYKKNIYFVPFYQDDPVNKTRSLTADVDMIIPAMESALKGVQIQPIIEGVKN